LSGATKGEHSLFHRIRGHVGRASSLDVTSAIFGAKAARIEVDCLMKKDGGQAKIRSLAIGSDKTHFDLHTNQIHIAPNCKSELSANAVMSDRARSVYYGLIEVAENAHGTDAYQSSKNLLLSEDARADSVPNLKILANEVKCSHGATVAQLNDDELFYMQSRGMSRKMAENLLVSGFIGKTVAEIPGKFGRDKVQSTLSTTGMSLEA
jgi:Fe-S cluster assembly protein SufD